jgi:predicted regulator of Ras-like GTPase activity (Roadblock/LC7/MglB family)
MAEAPSRIVTPFSRALQTAVENTPSALAAAFAAPDGELVDSYAASPSFDWAIVTAYYGVILAHFEAAFGTLHFGSAEHFWISHERLCVVVHTVSTGYFVMLALEQPAPIAAALIELGKAAVALRAEMA